MPVELLVRVCAFTADTPNDAAKISEERTLFLMKDFLLLMNSFIIRLRVFLALLPMQHVEE